MDRKYYTRNELARTLKSITNDPKFVGPALARIISYERAKDHEGLQIKEIIEFYPTSDQIFTKSGLLSSFWNRFMNCPVDIEIDFDPEPEPHYGEDGS